MGLDLRSHVDKILDELEAGRVVIVPTDTVYGLAADPTNAEAIQRLFDLKERPEGVPVAVLIGEIEQAKALIEWGPSIDELAQTYWPGGLTIVGTAVDAELTLGSLETVGVRLPDHDLLRECARRFGPIACTSANRHGEPTITNPAELDAAFGTEVGVIVDGGILEDLASTVVDMTCHPPAILRQGLLAPKL